MLSELIFKDKARIGNQLLKEDILKALEIIDGSKENYIFPRPKTITSFLKGTKNSPFYDTFYEKHKDISGKYPDLTIDKVKLMLRLMEENGMVCKDGLNYIATTQQPKHKLDGIFLYNKNSLEYSESDLLRLSNWEEGHKSTAKIRDVKTLDGWMFPADSKEEVSVVKKLSKERYYKILRGQSFVVPYTTIKADKPKKYYPDIVMLTHDNRIAFIEVKPISFMSNYYTIAKYNGLKKYAKKHKYMCTMCDRNFQTFESLMKKRVNKQIKVKFMQILQKHKSFREDHYLEWVKGMTTKEAEKVKRNIHVLIIQEKLMNYGIFKFDVRNLKRIKKL